MEFLNEVGGMSRDSLRARLEILFRMLCLFCQNDSAELRKLVAEWENIADVENDGTGEGR